MVFVTTENDCHICLSHKLNHDGYLRKRWGNSKENDYELFHRFIYRAANGDIPEGYEVDHVCRNRACVNPKHLQVLSKYEHRVKTNKERSDDYRLEAKKYWEDNDRPKPSTMVKRFGYVIYRWVREWKALTNG